MRLVLAAWLVARAAAAETWHAQNGSIEPGRLPGSFVIASNAAPGRYSEATVLADQPAPLPYQFAVTWRRLGPEAGRSMHVIVAGGVVLLKGGKILLYAYDDAAFASAGWQDVPGYAEHDEHRVVVVQDAQRVVVTVDGKPAATFALAVHRTTARVGVGMKSAPGLRSEIYVHDLAVTHQ
jgi:hypothetical protein